MRFRRGEVVQTTEAARASGLPPEALGTFVVVSQKPTSVLDGQSPGEVVFLARPGQALRPDGIPVNKECVALDISFVERVVA